MFNITFNEVVCHIKLYFNSLIAPTPRSFTFYVYVSADSKDPSINAERLRALCILTYSDNVELQRSAALCFAELSERSEYGG